MSLPTRTDVRTEFLGPGVGVRSSSTIDSRVARLGDVTLQSADAVDAHAGENKSQRVYRKLRDAILAGEFSPGYRLVLSRLAEEYDVSPVPVREAVRRLEAQGLVSHTRNVGFEVTGVNPQDYGAAMQTLAYLEGAATSLSAPYVSADVIGAARAVNEEMRAVTRGEIEPVRLTELNSRFHQILCSACPNGHLLDLLGREWANLSRIRRSTFTYIPERAQVSVEEHDQILALLAAGADSREIEMATREHTLRTMYLFLERKNSGLS